MVNVYPKKRLLAFIAEVRHAIARYHIMAEAAMFGMVAKLFMAQIHQIPMPYATYTIVVVAKTFVKMFTKRV